MTNHKRSGIINASLIVLFIMVISPALSNAQPLRLPPHLLRSPPLDDFIRRTAPIQWPRAPVDQIFGCGLYNVTSNHLSNLWHILTFDGNGTVELDIETDTGATIGGNGVYTALRGVGLVGYRIDLRYTLANQNFHTVFNIQNVTRTQGLDMLRYFDAFGVMTENGANYIIQMYCQAGGHSRNNFTNPVRFVCDQQVDDAGTYQNAIEVNGLTPGNAFRQRDFYATGNTGGTPTLTERSQYGMYLENPQNQNQVTFDFNRNPELSRSIGMFTDYNVLHGTVNAPGTVLVIDEFPAGQNRCYLSP